MKNEELTRALTDASRRGAEAGRQAHHDGLTGLPNRRLLTEQLQRAIEIACRDKRQPALLFIDLDGFKVVNDRFRHSVGDEVLTITAARSLKCMREDDIALRYGGGEFVVMLSHISDPDAALAIAQDVRRRVSQRHSIDTNVCHVSASIGVALYPMDGSSCGALLKSVDAAMYCRKAARHSQIDNGTKIRLKQVATPAS